MKPPRGALQSHEIRFKQAESKRIQVARGYGQELEWSVVPSPPSPPPRAAPSSSSFACF